MSMLHSEVKTYLEKLDQEQKALVSYNGEHDVAKEIKNILAKDTNYKPTIEDIAEQSISNFIQFEVKRNVEGPLKVEQTRKIAELLEGYKRHKKPMVKDYLNLRSIASNKGRIKRHDSDYYLIDKVHIFHNFLWCFQEHL